ncbi:HK97-gp10 family putative phage morphogenesis protein [Falsirhodobacter halotolerans]|uniref:HK97-gp10 family putative phage morphogenesis protein n=1 Tax=Falsirhodobacter halotolerans TaxID=1146892 RepID=UPI001FD08258|nr:HK97-gp10 family putative phage morphogenesis protein [Falsirhodobacter halotolerans]MCJ8139567.1 HK97 gp10 family phage protein [Falsirhodobacter halotolerans]
MKLTVRTSGFRELDAALKQFKKSTAKGVMRRALKAAAQPMADLGSSLAPRGDTETLAPSVTAGAKLSKRQKAMHRKMFRSDKASVEMFVGAGPLSSAHNQEFGNINHGAQPFMRPAWDREAKPTLARLGDEMGKEIDKTAKRVPARAAKLQRKDYQL